MHDTLKNFFHDHVNGFEEKYPKNNLKSCSFHDLEKKSWATSKMGGGGGEINFFFFEVLLEKKMKQRKLKIRG